ncbi:phosphoenolpyruvate--protein phosphotransferase [Psychromonas sp. RZ22]|uniref:phosphoenolpyruvate--protein phosphotransferase n=1 Tax=Psychromonas algarum TaxID=2555643 RepID=UPI0010689C2A|nr:phosphoenolpyruvate--protein phosphotransferase [Psychromonas sp. RZ22]TEW53353.1 phosphoenolpyruvate--protein phosphotransferase [Psychromonas sp. RZ22]
MLSQLRQIVEQFGEANTLPDAMNLLVQQTKATMNLDCCSIFITNKETKKLTLMASEGLASQVVGATHFNFDEGIVGLVYQKGEPINLANVSEHPQFKYLPSSNEELFNSFLGTPIIHKRQVLGVLVAQQSSPRLFDKLEESFLVTLAVHLGSVLSNTILDLPDKKIKKNRSIQLQGSPASPGICINKAHVLQTHLLLSDIEIEVTDQADHEMKLFNNAVQMCADEFSNVSITLKEKVSQDAFMLFDVYGHLLKDKALLAAVEGQIFQHNLTAKSAIKKVAEGYIKQFESMNDPYLKERAVEVRDVGQRLLYHLSNRNEEKQHFPDPLILVAEEVTISMLAMIPAEKLKGIVSVRGGLSSHVAILSRALGIPAVLGAPLRLKNIHYKNIIIDGYAGTIIVEPEHTLVSQYQVLLDEENELKELVDLGANQAAMTKDGCEVEVLLNTGLNINSDVFNEQHFSGIGLYRSELPFMLSNAFPTEQQQANTYRRVFEQCKNLPVTMRTLDIGGDKQLTYFPINEENPFLGWRGIRLTLDHPDIFLVQIRAMLRASIDTQNLRIMLPMVSSVGEVEEAKRLIIQAWQEICVEQEFSSEQFPLPDIGVMIEVPSAIFIIDQLAPLVDFFSIGSNDLTQYLLAVDRNNSRVADLFDSYHPAVLQAMQLILQQSQKNNVEVSICGELAGDPIGVLILLGLGYRKLSMNAFNMNKVKYLLNNVTISELEACTKVALNAHDGAFIKQTFVDYLDEKGLGGFVRAGNK